MNAYFVYELLSNVVIVGNAIAGGVIIGTTTWVSPPPPKGDK